MALGHTEADTLFDIDNVALNTPDALSKALEEAGGSSGGDVTVVEMTGPDGKMQRVFEFPTVESKSDDYINEDRQAFSRKPPLWIRVGTFRGRATNPTFSEE